MRVVCIALLAIAAAACSSPSSPPAPHDAGAKVGFTDPGGGFAPPSNRATATAIAGTGLSASGGKVAIDPTYTQRRVSGTCTAPNAVAAVAQDGTVTCTTADASASGTATDLAVFTGPSALGNFAGSSPSACTAGQALTNEAIGATGALTNSCTTLISGTNNTLTKFTGTNTIGNSSVTDDGTTLTITKQIAKTSRIAPTAITGTIDDYAPTGLAGASWINQTTSGAVTLDGLTGGADGRELIFCNIGTSVISLVSEAAGSTAANRFLTTANATISLGSNASNSNACATLLYDGTASRWRVTALNTNGANTWNIFGSGTLIFNGTAHASSAGTSPSLTSCGTSPAITGGDPAFTVTTGSAATTCTITFARAYTTNAPVCVARTEGSATPPTCTTSTTAITCTVTVASTVYKWICFAPN